jgi:hypothetical protein
MVRSISKETWSPRNLTLCSSISVSEDITISSRAILSKSFAWFRSKFTTTITMSSPTPSPTSWPLPNTTEQPIESPAYQPDSEFFEALMKKTSEYKLNPEEDRAVKRAWTTFRGSGGSPYALLSEMLMIPTRLDGSQRLWVMG